MKQFNQFQENVAAASIKVGSKLIPALMTGIGAAGTLYQSKKISDMSDDEIEKSGTIDELQLGKNPERKRKKLKNVVKKLGKEIVDAGKQVKKGLSVKPKDVTGKKYRTPEMGNQSPAQYLRDLVKKQKEKGK